MVQQGGKGQVTSADTTRAPVCVISANNLFVRKSHLAEPEVRGQSENEKVHLTTLGRRGNFHTEYINSEPQG